MKRRAEAFETALARRDQLSKVSWNHAVFCCLIGSFACCKKCAFLCDIVVTKVSDLRLLRKALKSPVFGTKVNHKI